MDRRQRSSNLPQRTQRKPRKQPRTTKQTQHPMDTIPTHRRQRRKMNNNNLITKIIELELIDKTLRKEQRHITLQEHHTYKTIIQLLKQHRQPIVHYYEQQLSHYETQPYHNHTIQNKKPQNTSTP